MKNKDISVYFDFINEQQWDSFTKKSKSYTIFHTSKWLKTFGSNVKFLVLKNCNGNILAGTSYQVRKKFGLNISIPPPLTPYGGILYDESILDNMNYVNRISSKKKWTRLILRFIKEKFNLWCTNLVMEHDDFHPFIWEKFDIFVHHTYTLNLRRKEDEIWRNMYAKRRNDINRAVKDGIEILRGAEENYMEILTSLVRKTFQRQSMDYNVANIWKVKEATDNFMVFLARLKSDIIAGILTVWDENRAYYIAGGYDFEKAHHGAQALAIWEAIKFSKKIGLKEFDFEGSIVENIERFFRGFGGRLITLHSVCFYKLPVVKFIVQLSQRNSFFKKIRRRIFNC